MFEFITISNGVAVVQHGATGHVYRFRPRSAGVWSRLALDRVDACHHLIDDPGQNEAAALLFAEEAVSACFLSAAESLTATHDPAPDETLAHRSARVAPAG
jgi:hypothetical protein